MNLLDDQIQNMLLNDAFYIYVGVHYQPHMTYRNWAQWVSLIKVTVKLKDWIFVPDKHKTIIILYPVILKPIYGHSVLNWLLRAVV